MGIPLRARGQVIGYLIIGSCTAGVYGQAEATLAQTFADGAAIALENARLYKQAQQLAITDSLTGLFNRRHFMELAQLEFERARRYGHSLAMVMLDIDHFKQVNDRHGHAAGDQALRAIGKRLQCDLRENDILGRYGGEEFVVLMPETGLHEAQLAAERLRKRVCATQVETEGIAVQISASLGVATIDPQSGDLDSLILRADQALYLAKEEGRNRVASWNS